ncbi:hypothetical protein GKR54_15040 [Providencia alcalifaciens]|uniref:hypothetical protein n=1 Tax=Providencia alcalifaciens TaxID=126385 RepID=UPI0012B5AE8B|nr:hypothetical protein [Providencia alcalifaciens]MTC32395.1 hypothetical protein [Providencia alcalifaciens]
MKGTTLTELNKAYLRQGRFIAGRYIHANVKYFRQRTDAIFFEHELAADKHKPRGKAYQRIMAIENMARAVKFKALQEKISQREASNAGN